LQAQVTSSDALKNAPFALFGKANGGTPVHIFPNDGFAKLYTTKASRPVNIVKIPKKELGFVPVATYTTTEMVEHMPLVRGKLYLYFKLFI
jgi:hypothetical protein